MRRGAVVMSMLMLLGLGGCGAPTPESSREESTVTSTQKLHDPSATTNTTVTSRSSANGETSRAGEGGRLTGLNISEADLGNGWEVFDATESASAAKAESFAMCGLSVPEPTAVVFSPLFINRGTSSQVGSTVAQWGTTEQAEAVSFYETAEAQDCFRKRVVRNFDSEQSTPPVGDVAVAVTPLALGEHGMRLDVDVELASGLPDGTTRILVTQTVIRVGRVIAILEYGSGDDPHRDAKLVETLGGVLAERLHRITR